MQFQVARVMSVSLGEERSRNVVRLGMNATDVVTSKHHATQMLLNSIKRHHDVEASRHRNI